jgi:TonB family protein
VLVVEAPMELAPVEAPASGRMATAAGPVVAGPRRAAVVRLASPWAAVSEGAVELEAPGGLWTTGNVQASTGPYLGEPLARGGGFSLPTRPPAEPAKPKEPAAPLRVGGQVQEANIVHRVMPVYPPLARQARIAGAVMLEGIIARDGTVKNLRVLSGHPLLAGAALEAVRQWRYRPTLLNGEPVEVIAPIAVNFVLGR